MPDQLKFLADRVEPVKIEMTKIDVSRNNLANLQRQLGESRILDAALNHMEAIGVDSAAASFELDFGLKW